MAARLKALEVTVVLFKRAEPENKEGATADMDTVRIDKSKLTAEEAAAWEAMVRKAGVPDESGSPAPTSAAPAGGETAPCRQAGRTPRPRRKGSLARLWRKRSRFPTFPPPLRPLRTAERKCTRACIPLSVRNWSV